MWIATVFVCVSLEALCADLLNARHVLNMASIVMTSVFQQRGLCVCVWCVCCACVCVVCVCACVISLAVMCTNIVH